MSSGKLRVEHWTSKVPIGYGPKELYENFKVGSIQATLEENKQ